jgi:ferritin
MYLIFVTDKRLGYCFIKEQLFLKLNSFNLYLQCSAHCISKMRFIVGYLYI